MPPLFRFCYKEPMAVGGTSRVDFNVLGGFTAVKMLGEDKLLSDRISYYSLNFNISSNLLFGLP